VKQQPLLTSFPSTVFATAKRKIQAAIQAARKQLISDSLSGYALLFEPILGSDFLRQIDETKRQRHYGTIPTFWAWLGQILELNAACTRAVSMVQTWNIAQGLPQPSSNTTAYCNARSRMSMSFLQSVADKTTSTLNARVIERDQWRGLTLKAIDGSSLQLLDTVKNQKRYPQPTTQREGCGHPVMGIVGVVNLSHGGWEGFETFAGRKHDSRVAPRLLKHVHEGDLMLADRAFCTYQLMAQIRAKKAHVVMRLHQSRHRKLDWRRGKKVSPIERLVTWVKSKNPPAGSDLTQEEWDQLPDEMTFRYIKLGYENRCGEKQMLVVVTDLLDPETHPAEEVADLYLRRWEIEVKLRDLKTTLRMEMLRVKSPEMAERTLLMMQISYNLIRALMQEGAHHGVREILEISFKQTIDLVVSMSESYRPLAGKPRKLRERHQILIEEVSQRVLEIRPYRLEPRAIKRRPKSYPLLTAPRRIFVEKDTRSNAYKKTRVAA